MYEFFDMVLLPSFLIDCIIITRYSMFLGIILKYKIIQRVIESYYRAVATLAIGTINDILLYVSVLLCVNHININYDFSI